MESLPEIPKLKPSLVEASGKRTARGTQSNFEDSDLDLKESLASAYSTRADLTCSNRSLVSTGAAGRSPPGGAFTPSPPPGGPILRNGGISPSPRGQSQLRRVSGLLAIKIVIFKVFMFAVRGVCAFISWGTRSQGTSHIKSQVFAARSSYLGLEAFGDNGCFGYGIC